MSESYFTAEQKSLSRNLSLGCEYLLAGRAEDAIALNQKLLVKFSGDPRVLSAMGESLMYMNRPFEAAEYFQKGLAISPDNKDIKENIRKLQTAGSWN
jgi:tetratricopeptide (TPR) repeat protein